MFERFTPRARRTLVLAQEEARDLGHPLIRPEDILLSLIRGEGVASAALSQAGVDYATVRERVAERIQSVAAAQRVQRVPFSTEAKKCLELGLRSALELGHNYIGTEHLLLGLLKEQQDAGEPVEDLIGVRVSDVRDLVVHILTGVTARGAPSQSPALRSAMDVARHEAGPHPVTTGYLLKAFAADGESQAARALSALGVSAESVTSAVEQVNVAGTSDAAPLPKTMSLTIGDSTRVIEDPEIATALKDMSEDELRAALKKAVRPRPKRQAAS